MLVDVAVCLPFSKTFLYSTERELEAGVRVLVPFQRREIEGFVVGSKIEAPPGIAPRPIRTVMDAAPLIRPDVLDLCRWMSDYYVAPLGNVLKSALPPAITQKHVDRFAAADLPPLRVERSLDLNSEQAAVFEQIAAATGFSTMLLHGVTGSGKTELYLRAVEHCQARGRSCLILVPEISLTPQLSDRFLDRFPDRVAVLHSSLTRKQRIEEWLRIFHGLAPIVIGTRSAVFAPLMNLGLVVVDEEHESSYKQEENPRYHARDSAIMRARFSGVPVLLGSATPSMESYRNAETGKYRALTLPTRVEARSLPEVEIVNMREEYNRAGRQVLLSSRLLQELAARLERREQALVLLNRRGYAMFLLCRHCGFTFVCEACSVAMTYHESIRRLMCHYCGLTRKPPTRCTECDSEYIHYVGEGTEKLEQELSRQFPDARIGRLDRDTMRHIRDYERVFGAFRAGKLDVLVGTQMIAKGHDFPNVTLVGVVGADSALSLPDFRSAERTFQLLTQVAGRSGRGEQPGEVVIQSYFPDHYIFQIASTHRFEDFYAREIRYRRAMFYPPVTSLAGVLVRDRNKDRAAALARDVGHFLDSVRTPAVRILGPAPAPLEKLNRMFRFQLLVKSSSRATLHRMLGALQAHLEQQKVGPTRVVIDVDPVSLM